MNLKTKVTGKALFICMAMLLLFGGSALAVQSGAFSPPTVNVATGGSFDIKVTYNADTNAKTVFAARLHYNSNLLTYNTHTVLHTGGLAGVQDNTEAAAGIADTDVNTDRVLIAGWNDVFGGNWPGVALPLDVITVKFDAKNTAGVTNINFTGDGQDTPVNGTGTAVTITAPTPVLSVTPASRNVAVAAGTTTFTVANTGEGTLNWTAAEAAGWFAIAPANGSLGAGATADITVTYDENTGAARTDNITVTDPAATGSPVTVSVNQAGVQPVLTVAPSSRDLGLPAGTTTFTVTNSGTGTMNWTATEAAGWFAIAPANGSLGAGASADITVTYDENTGAARSEGITIAAPGATGAPLVVTVNQAGVQPVLSVTPASRTVTTPAGTTTFTVANTGTGTMNWTATEAASWFAIAPANGSLGAGATADITVTYDENTGVARSANITVAAPGATGTPVDVAVNQNAAGPVLAVTPAAQNVSIAAGTTTFTVANTGAGTLNWTATETADWFTIAPANGSLGAGATADITVTYLANAGAARSANITVAAPGATGSPVDVAVNQAAVQPVLAVTPGARNVTTAAGTTTFTVANTGTGTMNWTAAEAADWFTIAPVNGSLGAGATADITVTYLANTGAARSADITVTAAGATGSPATATVNQEGVGPKLNVTSTSVQPVPAAGGNATFLVSNTGAGVLNYTAVVTSGNTWLSIPTGSTGTQGDTITALCAANAGLERTGTITVTVDGSNPVQSQVVAVKQDGKKVGDADGNGVVNIFDALEVARYTVNAAHPIDLLAANVDCTGGVDIFDALLISEVDAGLKTFPVCP
jgi:uncharacterized cupredoxin-like copper-binding protein